MGGKTKRIKNIFTRVLKGHLAVFNFRLSKKTGSIIDRVENIESNKTRLCYGTGHGVGYFLNVHEGPQAISKNNKVVFKVGMIVLMNQDIMRKINLELGLKISFM